MPSLKRTDCLNISEDILHFVICFPFGITDDVISFCTKISNISRMIGDISEMKTPHFVSSKDLSNKHFNMIIFRWFEYQTEALSCQQNRLVPASTSHRKDLIERIDNLKAGGTSELK